MTYQSDAFGPWTPPGSNGRPSDEESSSASTPTEVSSSPFWTSTMGVLDTGKRTQWERCQLGNLRLPGLVKVVVSKPAERKIDVKSPAGKSKGKTTVKGWEPAEIKISILLWTPAHWEEWKFVRKELKDPTDKKESDPQEIIHPVTEDSGISAVLIKHISGLEDSSIRGAMMVNISALEWTVDSKSTGTGTPKGAKSAEGAKPSRKDAEAAWLALVAAGGNYASWEDIARAHGIDPPGPPPPIPPGAPPGTPV